MEYAVSPRNGGGSITAMKGPKPPNLSDFDLTSVRIEPAENGCIVECNYRMKPAVESKMKAKAGKDGYVDYDLRNPSVKKVFAGDEAEQIKMAIHAALSGKKEKENGSGGSKIKVRKV